MREENFRCETNRKGGGLQKGPRLTGWGRWGSDNFTRRTMGELGAGGENIHPWQGKGVGRRCLALD